MARITAVLEDLVSEKGISVDEVCERVEELGYHKGTAHKVIKGCEEPCIEFLAICEEQLELDSERLKRLQRAIIEDTRERLARRSQRVNSL